MPVGQAVIATMLRCPAPGAASVSAPEAAGAASPEEAAVAPAAAPAPAAPAAAAPAPAPAAGSLGGGETTSPTICTISSREEAARSPARKSFLTRARASLVSSFMCSEPVPSAAAMRKTMSAGPSLAPKSTGLLSRAKPSEPTLTADERQCGIAKPPGMPVGESPSRSMAESRRPTASARPVSPTMRARPAMTSSLVSPRSTSSATRSGSMSGVS